GKAEAQDHAYDYLRGLMVCPERKSIEPIALRVGHGDVSGLQKFVGAGPWAYDDVMAEAQALFADELAPSAAGSPVAVVVVAGGRVVAEHPRCYDRSRQVLDPVHFLAALGRRPAALDHAPVYRDWQPAAALAGFRRELEARYGVPAGTRQFVRVL